MKIRNFLNSQELRTAISGSLLIKGTSVVLALINSILLAKLLGVTSYGVYVLIMSAAQLAVIPATFGLPVLITRYFTVFETRQDLAAMKGLFRRAHSYLIVVALIIGLLGLLALQLGWIQPDLKRPLLIGWFLTLFIGLNILRAAAIRGLRFVILGALPELLIRNVFLLIGLTSFWMAGLKLTVNAALLIHLSAIIVSFLVGLWILYRKIGRRWRSIKPAAVQADWWREALSYGGISGIQQLKTKGLNYLLYFIAGVEAVALYDVAYKAAGLITQFVDAIHSGVAPHISQLYQKQAIDRLQGLVRKVVRFNSLFTLPLVLIVVLGGNGLLDLLFDPPFAQAYWPMTLLVMGSYLNACFGPLIPLLNMTGNQLYLLKSQVLVTVLLFATSIPLIDRFGVLGAAIAYSSIWILQNLDLLRYIRSNILFSHRS